MNWSQSLGVFLLIGSGVPQRSGSGHYFLIVSGGSDGSSGLIWNPHKESRPIQIKVGSGSGLSLIPTADDVTVYVLSLDLRVPVPVQFPSQELHPALHGSPAPERQELPTAHAHYLAVLGSVRRGSAAVSR
ncbi:hypothetical protein OJAV_G00011470 [Oryzias javanicus]|uniref:Uncharacterized protein n=1 Tax=Oryzias javanicus TaxID=123683 RepID=A0A3S2Q286_ORYJA|nr:hypothetical protein OJAV_G00011470 [Oryzias javanicus]